MRDIVLTLLVAGSLPFILWRPYIGVLVWSWLSYMNPHRFTWGFAYDLPFAQVVAITLLASVLFSREKIRLPSSGVLWVWIAFLIWMVVTTVFAVFPETAMVQLIKVLKIQLVTFLTLILINDQKRLNLLVWVIVLSIGFFSVKGGLFTLLTGGSFRVYGPPGSFIEENNSLAVASLMILPLMVYLRQIYREKQWIKHALTAAILFSILSIVGSQSRGALVAIIAVGGFFWLKTRAKLISGLVLAILAFSVFTFMPESWQTRMSTIQTYQEDGSAMGRLNAWQYTINVASDRLTGAGFESWSSLTFSRWAPNPKDVHAAHSIFFGVLGDHGWPGLILFLLVLWMAWRKLSFTIRVTKSDPEYAEQNLLARMLQVSMVAFMSGGAFLSLAYFDLPWHIIAITILLAAQLKGVPLRAERRVPPSEQAIQPSTVKAIVTRD